MKSNSTKSHSVGHALEFGERLVKLLDLVVEQVNFALLFSGVFLLTEFEGLGHANRSVGGEPDHVLVVKEPVDVRLSSVVVRGVLLLEVDYEVHVVPQIVVLLRVEVEALLGVTVQLKPVRNGVTYSVAVDVAHKALVLDVFGHKHGFLSQLRERVDDNTEHHI